MHDRNHGRSVVARGALVSCETWLVPTSDRESTRPQDGWKRSAGIMIESIGCLSSLFPVSLLPLIFESEEVKKMWAVLRIALFG